MYRCLAILIVVIGCRSATPQRTADDGAISGESPPLGVDAWAETSDAVTSSDGSIHDAASSMPDAGYAGSDAGTAGSVSCYSEGNPSAACTLPTHCCFTNYSAQHNGSCTSSSCTWGTINCDGPEDCGAGQRCCAHAIEDPNDGVVGYTLACQQNACGAAPLNEELCHPTTMATGTCSAGSCVNTVGHNNDLPRTLSVCR